jgi:serine/threonine protein phosphatase PrpC
MISPSKDLAVRMPDRKPRDDEIDVYGLTHPGKVRANNQDHFLICSLHKYMKVHHTSLASVDQLPLMSERLAFLAMVADGVGAHVGGQTASRLALEVVTQYVAHGMQCYYEADAEDDQTFMTALQEAAMQCHSGVIAQAEREPDLRGMATTLTMYFGVWPRVYLLQVGDSRCYIFREGQLTQISRDQTMAQELVDAGVMARAEADRTRWANVLSSAIGGRQTAPVVTRLTNAWHTVWLICSDGLTKHVPDSRIRERLEAMTSARQACDALLQDALEAGGSDNVTLIVGRTLPRDPA